MGCNMCVVQKPEEQYRVMFQKGHMSNMLCSFDADGRLKVNGKELSRLSGDPTLDIRDPVLSSILRRGARRRAGLAGAPGGQVPVTMGMADCVDSCTQTDISFQHMLTLGKSSQHPCGAPPPPDPPPSPPLPPLLEPYLFNELFVEPVYYDPTDYFDISQHEVDRQDELEYEEVELYKSRQQDKLGLTVCYRTDDEEDLGIYVGEVNPNSIAAMDGRIRKGDRILQINGVDIQNREEAVAILTREDSTNVSLLLARPEIENENQMDPDELDLEPLDNAVHLGGSHRAMNSPSILTAGPGSTAGRGVLRGHGHSLNRDSPDLLQTVLSNSQELDSGVGRTDESTRYEESSEHDLLGDDHTSASNTNATNTPGSMRKFLASRGETPPLLHSQDLQFSTDSLLGLDCMNGGGLEQMERLERAYTADPVRMMMPGLTEEECERYKELLEIKCYYEKNSGALIEGQGAEQEEGGISLDVNRNESLSQHEMALLEEELRHLEFKCRNILRAQKMQQLRERCMKAWPLEDKNGASVGAGRLDVNGILGGEEARHNALSDINELPERERSDKDSTSAYNTGGESCRSTPLVNEQYPSNSTQSLEGSDTLLPAGIQFPASTRQRERGARSERGDGTQANLNQAYSPHSHRRATEGKMSSPGAKVRSLSRDVGARRGSDGGVRRNPKGNGTVERAGGRSAENSPYLSRRHEAQPPQRFLSCMQLRSPSTSERLGGLRNETEGDASPMSLGSTCKDVSQASGALPLPLSPPLMPASPRMEWKVKIRSDGSRYVAKRPVRDRLLKARAMKIREERSGMTTDDDAVSEMKMGRYWSKEERKQQLLKAREQRRRREFMMQSRLDCLRERERDQAGGGGGGSGGGQQGTTQPQEPTSILELCHRRSMKKRSRRILDNWITIQELLAHGTRSADGKKVYNPLLSVTTV
ncbi:PDZ domain-containing protein 4-like isoform X1 [Salarias fasciatus]|uniref:PDZ domain-containing protein 4-like isoform X1 n=1 Tax=Salarias fasciatus TaxID=181472 RepID=UPI001176E961|nr:PDZ domain-containing protein 4-like isoform X1 [Salarias fasciatus]